MIAAMHFVPFDSRNTVLFWELPVKRTVRVSRDNDPRRFLISKSE